MSSFRRRLTRRRRSSYRAPRRFSARRSPATRFRRTTAFRTRRRRAVERKVVDTDLSHAVTLASEYAVLLNGIAVGADSNQRIGRKAVMRDLLLACDLQPATESADIQVVHVAVVQDKAPTGVLPDFDDIYDIHGLRILENTPRFKVRLHRQMQFKPTNTPVTGSDVTTQSRRIFSRIPLNFIETFSAGTNGLGSVSGNALYLLVFVKMGTVTVNITGRARLRFTET